MRLLLARFEFPISDLEDARLEAIKSGNLNSIQFFLDQDEWEDEFLTLAIKYNQVPVIKYLITTFKNLDLQTHFESACRDGKLEIIKILSSLVSNQERGLELAIQFKHPEIIQQIIINSQTSQKVVIGLTI